MLKRVFMLAGLLIVAACGYVDEYEEAVYDHQPVYCYQSIGKAVCFNEPYHRDADRLVNYYGPHPSRYDAPDAPEKLDLIAPVQTNVWVKDPEPVVTVSGVALSESDAQPLAVQELNVDEPNWLFDTILAPDPMPEPVSEVAPEDAPEYAPDFVSSGVPATAKTTPVELAPLAPVGVEGAGSTL